MFCGLFFCGADAISTSIADSKQVTTVTLTNGIYDYIFGSDDPDMKELDWNFDTAFYAKFKNNIHAGNVDYTSVEVSSMRIKRRKYNEHTWFTLWDIPIAKNEDFGFERFDRYAQAGQEYYYALVPVIENVEGNMNKNNILSEYKSYFILDKDVSYPILFNTALNLQINKQIGTVNTLGRKYPFVFSNGLSHYITGSLKFSLAPYENCEIITDKGYEYRKQFNEWIMNGNPKILKDWTGQIYMLSITSGVPIDYSFYDLPSYEIQFSEIGDVMSQDDMYNNNFTNVNFSLSSGYPV